MRYDLALGDRVGLQCGPPPPAVSVRTVEMGIPNSGTAGQRSRTFALVLLQVLAVFLLGVAGAAFLSIESEVRFAIAGTLAAHVVLLELSFLGILRGWRWAYGLGCLTCFPGAILLLARAGEASLLALSDGAVEYFRLASLMSVSFLLMAAPIPAMVAAYLSLPKKSVQPLRTAGGHGRLAQRPLKQEAPGGTPPRS